jgi:hypothetical protein
MRFAARLVPVWLCVIAPLVSIGCGGSSAPSQGELDRAQTAGAQQQRQEDRLKRLEQELKKNGNGSGNNSGGGGGGGGTPGGGTGGSGGATPNGQSCGDGITAGPNTTCSFARVVKDAYYSNGGGTFTAHSPVTGQNYRMTCGGSSPHVCTGGNNASVYFP